MPNCRWYESQSKMYSALTGYLKPKESEEKRENWNDPPHGDTGITGVTTRRLTSGNISSPSQPWSLDNSTFWDFYKSAEKRWNWTLKPT